MIHKRTHKLSFEQADRLLDKYYEGATSVAEEDALRSFLQQKGLPRKYDAEKAIFEHWGQLQAQSSKPSRPLYSFFRLGRAAAAIAIVLMGFIGYRLFIPAAATDVAYVNGKKIQNKEEIIELASSSLDALFSIDGIAEEHLKEFSDIEF